MYSLILNHSINSFAFCLVISVMSEHSNFEKDCMSVRFNCHGNQLFVLRRRKRPILYDVKTMDVICRFDYKTYYNACTMKSGSFAGLHDEVGYLFVWVVFF